MSWYIELINWYLNNKRELPWRDEKNGYLIWVSEVILQQTRVNQGIAYYLRFIERYPTVESLAEADEHDVLLLWQGLGYYSRARNLHKGAKQIVENFHSSFHYPPEELMKIRGIGHYTANAIASFTNDYPVPVVDGNVYRVVTRLFGIDDPVPSEKVRRLITDILQPVVSQCKSSIFNQALMELGALICLPQSPKCFDCPIHVHCFACKNNQQGFFPVKVKKAKPRHLFISYLHFVDSEGKTMLYLRKEGTWKGLYEFPCLQGTNLIDKEEVLSWLKNQNCLIKRMSKKYETKHQLTHKTIFAQFWEISLDRLPLFENLITFDIYFEEIRNYPIHQLMQKYINQL
ncbi:MAG: A/G-specific adenine glycosylase [Bacteroidia bacterium]|nr:A/G-specific adenine glycosylase [Bacteroidia bacterium]